MQTAAAPAIVKLAKIRKEYQEDFDDECILLDLAIENLCEELARVPWSAKTVENLGSTPPTPSACGVVELDSTPSPSASSSTPSASASTPPASASASAAVYQQDTAPTLARAPTTSPASSCSAAAEEEGEEMSFEVPCSSGAVTKVDGGRGEGGMDMVFGIRDSCAGLVIDKPSCQVGPVTADDDGGGDVDLDDMDVVDQQRGPMGMFEALVVQGEGLAYETSFLPTVYPAEDCDDSGSNDEKNETEEEEKPVVVRSATPSSRRGNPQVFLSRVAVVVGDTPVILAVPPIKVTHYSKDGSGKRSESHSEKKCEKKMEKKPGKKSENCVEKKCERRPEKRFHKISDILSEKYSASGQYPKEKCEKFSRNKYKKRSEKKSDKQQYKRVDKLPRETPIRVRKRVVEELVVDYVTRRTRSRPTRLFANRTASVTRAKSLKVKAGEAELRVGIG